MDEKAPTEAQVIELNCPADTMPGGSYEAAGKTIHASSGTMGSEATASTFKEGLRLRRT